MWVLGGGGGKQNKSKEMTERKKRGFALGTRWKTNEVIEWIHYEFGRGGGGG